MEQIIYVDVLVFLNTIVTFLLLLSASKLIKISPSPGRLVAGALTGGISSLVIFAPDMGLVLSVLVKLLFSVIITSVAYKQSSLRSIIRSTGYFFVVSFIFAGIILFVSSLPGLSVITYNNGVAYVDFSFFSLVVASTMCYMITIILNKITRHSRESDVLVNIGIETDGKCESLSAIYDTGNGLVDPFTGENIIIADRFKLDRLLPCDVRLYLEGCEDMCGMIRLVPCSTVTEDGLLPVFRADRVEVNDNGVINEIDKPLIAVCNRKLEHVILPAEIIGRKERRICNETTVC